jgi:hypothetical protein
LPALTRAGRAWPRLSGAAKDKMEEILLNDPTEVRALEAFSVHGPA